MRDTPYEDPVLCYVCGQDVDAGECVCPKCPLCGVQGDPRCYLVHGLTFGKELKGAYNVVIPRYDGDGCSTEILVWVCPFPDYKSAVKFMRQVPFPTDLLNPADRWATHILEEK